MSRKTNDYAWDLKLRPTLKLTLLAMADRTNEDHECFPSYIRLHEDTGLDIKTIQKNIGILLDLELIKDTGKRKGATQQVKVFAFTFKPFQKRAKSAANLAKTKQPKKGGLIEKHETKPPKNGCLKPPKNGCLKATQKRVTEPPSLEPPIEPPSIESVAAPTCSKVGKSKEAKSTATWNAYSRAYQQRYNNAPSPSAKQYKLLCLFVDEVGKDDAPLIATYYLTLTDNWFLKKFHDVGTLIQNANAIRTQWINQTNQTSIDVRQVEQQTSALTAHSKVKGMIERGEL